MSSTGALVQGAATPRTGTAARLVRGRLTVPASVVWSVKGQCGLRFSCVISVEDWLAPPANKEQQRVDSIVDSLKAGAVPLPLVHSSDPPEAEHLAKDLRRAARLLEALSDNLADNETVLASQGDKLQILDIAQQMVSTIADILSGSADEPSVPLRLASLRASCTQALGVAVSRSGCRDPQQ